MFAPMTFIILWQMEFYGSAILKKPQKNTNQISTVIMDGVPLMIQVFMASGMVAIDDDWSALRFRNMKYIKSASGKLPGVKSDSLKGYYC